MSNTRRADIARENTQVGGGVRRDVPLSEQNIGAWEGILEDYEKEQETDKK